ncbi:MAG: hypothetical protein U0800_16335 [Isosphaeraceae bacterium]
MRLRWQRLAYLAQWPLPLLYLSWERWIGLALLLVSWWDLFRIGRRTAGGRVVFEGTSDILSIPRLAALLTLAPEGRNLDLPALALAGRFLLGWLSAGPYVALLMAFLPDPRTGPSALEFVAPALLTIGLRQLLIRPIGWLWAWGGWVTWLIVMEPPVGLAFAVGTLPALAGIVRLSYRYEPRPLAIALVWASAAGAILAFGHGPIDSLRALLIDWGGSLRVGSHPSPIGIPGAPRFAVDWPVGTWILAVPLLGWLAYRGGDRKAPGGDGGDRPAIERPGGPPRCYPGRWACRDGGDGWTRSGWMGELLVVALLPTILLAGRPAPKAVPIAWLLAALAGLLAG